MEHLVSEVHCPPRPIDRFEALVGSEAVRTLLETASAFEKFLGGRVVWTVNSTAVGGGVAEMLHPLIGYSRGVGVDARWLVIGGPEEFFDLTKQLHHFLHGAPGALHLLDDDARKLYEETSRANAAELMQWVQPGDPVLLHDPQTAGLAPALVEHGARVVWRCHIGSDHRNEYTDRGWSFLQPHLENLPAYVFSRHEYMPPWLEPHHLTIIQPSIDAFSAKNESLSARQVHAIVVHTGLAQGIEESPACRVFTHADGTSSRVDRVADITRWGPAPPLEAPMVLQVSRWDPLKDMAGVMAGFALAAERSLIPRDAHLVLAGPDVRSVADDPEAPQVFADAVRRAKALPEAVRRRVHLVNLPTEDREENAVIVNALQRHAAVVIQKSLREGFGLTVTEAMWKGRPVVASAVGGIADQIDDGVNGRLLQDPQDLEAFAGILGEVLGNPAEAERLGRAARERVRERFLGIRHLLQYAALLRRVVAGPASEEAGVAPTPSA